MSEDRKECRLAQASSAEKVALDLDRVAAHAQRLAECAARDVYEYGGTYKRIAVRQRREAQAAARRADAARKRADRLWKTVE